MDNLEQITQDQLSQLQALAACCANCEMLNNTGEPNTLSLGDIQRIGSEMLSIIEQD